MPTLITQPTVVQAAGQRPKRIEEFVGPVNTGTEELSIARIVSPPGWEEPGQRPEFDEYRLVLKGTLRVITPSEEIDVTAGQAIICPRGEWVRYSSPTADGVECLTICLPAFLPQTVNRDFEE
ncbi:MAG: cupin domain-containing protein [Deltaproteobacteria bacterium]|nr:cupin domain-containing protein [Deltaproteobacteria bacterium]